MIEREENRAAKCSCNHGWVCAEHPDQPWEHDDRGAAGELCENPNCTKDRTRPSHPFIPARTTRNKKGSGEREPFESRLS